MSYYIRLLTPSRAAIDAETLRRGLAALERPDVVLIVDEGEQETDWTAIVAYTAEGEPIGLLTRDVVTKTKGDLAADELDDFREELAEALPKSGARWVKAYLSTVQTIYAIQLMGAAFDDRGAGVPGLILEVLQAELGGIAQADGEGFSNEAGDHVVWQFGDDAEGPRVMAVLEDKAWTAFEMDLADPAQRAAFQDGRVPEGAAIVNEG